MSVKYANKITNSIKDLRSLINTNKTIGDRIVTELKHRLNPDDISTQFDNGLKIKTKFQDNINVPANLRTYHNMFVDIIKQTFKENDIDLQIDSNICITVMNGHNSVLFII